MTRPSEVLRAAHTQQASSRREGATRYLNRAVQAGQATGGWLSEIGFYASRPFAYAQADTSNLMPAPDDPREVTGVELVIYGLKRDADRLSATSGADALIRATRASGATGRAPFPGAADYLGAADLADDSSLPAKTSSLLARIRTSGSGEAYHAVVTRAGAVYITASVAQEVAAEGGVGKVRVAVEGAAYKLRSGGDLLDAPPTQAQQETLAVLVAKLRAIYPGLPLSYLIRVEEPVPALGALWWTRTSQAALDFEALVTNEGVYDASSEVFRSRPPATSHRAESQIALGHVDTLGESSLILAAYSDIAAADRSEQMQEPGRVRHFVQRARTSLQDADHSGEAAGHVAAADSFAPVIAPATNSGPFVYNYRTGRWGDNER